MLLHLPQMRSSLHLGVSSTSSFVCPSHNPSSGSLIFTGASSLPVSANQGGGAPLICVQSSGPYLIKPHVGVKTVRGEQSWKQSSPPLYPPPPPHPPSPLVSGGQLAFVEGHYSYHHYMQDGFNDDVRW